VVAELLAAASIISACSIQGNKRGEPAIKAEPNAEVRARTAPAPAAAAAPGCFDKVCIKDKPATLVNFRFDQVAAPYPDAASCKTYNSDFPATNTAARPCLCDNCFKLQQQCDALKGCREELQCVLDSGCTDIGSCYMNAPPGRPDAPCRAVVDKWGNTSIASTLVEYLGECAAANHCNAAQ